MLRKSKNKDRASEGANVSYEEFLRLLRTPETRQACETLVSSLHLLNSTRPLKTILVTSTQPEEGKTTVTVNLALAVTLARKKVLIIDADLRRPRVHEILRLENKKGLADVLTGSLNVQEVVQTVRVKEDTGNEQALSAVPSGRTSLVPYDALGSSNMRSVLDFGRSGYDLVLLDSPPILSVNDALLLAPLVDGVILALHTGAVTDKDATSARDRVIQAGGNILGVVMNRFDPQTHGPAFHPYGNYYSRTVTR